MAPIPWFGESWWRPKKAWKRCCRIENSFYFGPMYREWRALPL